MSGYEPDAGKHKQILELPTNIPGRIACVLIGVFFDGIVNWSFVALVVLRRGLKDGRIMNIFGWPPKLPTARLSAMTMANVVKTRFHEGRSFRTTETGAYERRLARADWRRPGIFAWINRAGDGKDWLQVDLQSHQNENHLQEAITRADQTTSYTEVAALDEQSVIVIYDRIPNGWKAIPSGD